MKKILIINTLVTDDQYAVVMGIISVMGTAVSLFGLVSNAMIIRTFTAMGVDDGMSVSFLFLSISELVCFLMAIGQEVSIAFWVVEIGSHYNIYSTVHPYVFVNFFGNARNCLFDVPVLITLYLAVAKCMCVVKPLHFKNMFSVSRSVWVTVGICIFSVGSYVPIFANTGVTWEFDKNINRTRPMLWASPYRDVIKNIIWTVRDSVPCLASQVIIVICIYFMSRTLLEAAKFRGSLVAASTSRRNAESYDNNNQGMKRPNLKETQIIQQVVLISAVYIVGNTPKIVIFLAFILVPGLTLNTPYQNVYLIIINIRELIEMITSSVNIFIYYKYNSKFRSHCKC
ncbi:unnamed protein product [Lymnaea stagnalis]|uniref:G-protein coupled receptors family 1 profile domain-containing protein n=1 Tax=Lymnaea stagnalis TaxID=6523 RepID=A0AAV2IHC2_LYMST